MDSQETKTDNFELPPPTTGAPSETIQAPEQGPSPELKAGPGTSAPAGSQATVPPVMVTGAAAPLSATSNATTAGLAAEDADLIEKAWVEKAKQIVAETRGDPFVQNKEINKVKADYIKKRYNKDIKLASE